MHYDALIIGAGMSGLAAGIRLAQFGQRVAVLEKHYLWGGLNSFYKLAGRRFDSGLHALTNWAPKGTRRNPLARALRQLRIPYDALELGQQSYSESALRIDGEILRLRFSNEPELLRSEVARLFPAASARFEKLLAELPDYESFGARTDPGSARRRLSETLREPLLEQMLMLPALYYGSPREDDLDWSSFAILMRAVMLEGMCRPEGGVKHLLDLLVARYKQQGGELLMRSGVRRVLVEDGRARGVELEDGRELSAERVISSAGLVETRRLVGDVTPEVEAQAGRLTFLESISVLDVEPAQHGLESTITFFNDGPRFSYRAPTGNRDEGIDPRSGVICCPNNYHSRQPLPEGLLRVTVLADPTHWHQRPQQSYPADKERAADQALASAVRFVPDLRAHTVFRDAFTPRTITRFTGHVNGAIYGSPTKTRSGRTEVENLFLCGTDQGLLGIIGAMLSGIEVANHHVLRAAAATDPLPSN